MNKVRDKWNRIYSKDRLSGPPAAVLTDNDNILPIEGIALDLACGLGTNSLFLATRGLEVHAWDISKVAVNDLAGQAGSLGLNIQTRVVNITAAVLPAESYDLVLTSQPVQGGLFATRLSRQKNRSIRGLVIPNSCCYQMSSSHSFQTARYSPLKMRAIM